MLREPKVAERLKRKKKKKKTKENNRAFALSGLGN